MGILYSALIFSFVVFIHELGHFLVGLKLGANPKEFSIGFGAPLFVKEYKGVTFKFGSLPFGGYVRFEKDANNKDHHLRLSHWKQIIVAFAGPLANIILSYLMLFALVFSILISPPETKIKAKIFQDLQATRLTVMPAINQSIASTNEITIKSVGAFMKIFKEEFKATNLVTETIGPIGITKEVNNSYKKGSFLILYFMTMFLSLSLGVTNLIPFGILDGGRILSSSLKMIFNEKYVGPILLWYDRVSIVFLLGLALFTTIKDLVGLF